MSQEGECVPLRGHVLPSRGLLAVVAFTNFLDYLLLTAVGEFLKMLFL